MPAKSDPRLEGDHEGHREPTAIGKRGGGGIERAGSEYYYRRSLNSLELLPAIGVGVAAGLLAFFMTRTLIQRTPLTSVSGRDGALKGGTLGGRGTRRRLEASNTNGG